MKILCISIIFLKNVMKYIKIMILISFHLVCFLRAFHIYSDKLKPIFAPSDSDFKLINDIGPYILRRFYRNDFFKNITLKFKKLRRSL